MWWCGGYCCSGMVVVWPLIFGDVSVGAGGVEVVRIEMWRLMMMMMEVMVSIGVVLLPLRLGDARCVGGASLLPTVFCLLFFPKVNLPLLESVHLCHLVRPNDDG